MAFSDWYEVLDKQVVGGQDVLNVYQVERVDIGQDAQQIFNAFEVSVLPFIVSAQPNTVTHTSVEVRSLDNPFDFFNSTPVGNVGLRVGESFSQFYAATLQFNRTRTDMKNGQKRFVAGIEGDSVAGAWDGAFVTLLGLLGGVIVAPWQVGAPPGVDVCRFGVLKRICVGTPPPVPCTKYRLPIDDAELEFYLPTTFIVRSQVRSQVSRKQLS